MTINTRHFKKKLEEEKERLESRLEDIAKRNPDNPDDWQTKPSNLNVLPADKNEVADTFEEFENRQAVEVELEKRLKDVVEALEKVNNGNYGVCEKGGEMINEKRLEANPAAKTCVEHDH